MTTTIRRKGEVRGFIRDARISLRALEQALKVNDLDYAIDMAAQASGCAGEAENILRDQDGQKAVLRQNKSARAARRKFPVGAKVTSADYDGLPVGTVIRHVPQSNAQGGVIVVEWPNGQVGRHGPISVP